MEIWFCMDVPLLVQILKCLVIGTFTLVQCRKSTLRYLLLGSILAICWNVGAISYSFSNIISYWISHRHGIEYQRMDPWYQTGSIRVSSCHLLVADDPRNDDSGMTEYNGWWWKTLLREYYTRWYWNKDSCFCLSYFFSCIIFRVKKITVKKIFRVVDSTTNR